MKYLLGTNICVYFMKHMPNVINAFRVKRSEGVAISSITLAELDFGVWNSNAYEKNRGKLIDFITLVKILDFDTVAALEYGKICSMLRRKGTPIGNMDMLIAAHAKAEGFVVVTNNTREFERVDGLCIEDWSV